MNKRESLGLPGMDENDRKRGRSHSLTSFFNSSLSSTRNRTLLNTIIDLCLYCVMSHPNQFLSKNRSYVNEMQSQAPTEASISLNIWIENTQRIVINTCKTFKAEEDFDICKLPWDKVLNQTSFDTEGNIVFDSTVLFAYQRESLLTHLKGCIDENCLLARATAIFQFVIWSLRRMSPQGIENPTSHLFTFHGTLDGTEVF